MLKLALRDNARIIVASTSEIYGDPLEHPQSESYFGNVNPIGPRSVYDEAKRYQEAITAAYMNNKNLNVGIIRIFNTYGSRMRINDGRAIPNFLNQAINNKDLTIYGNGMQTRSFCYISDTINGIFKLLKSNYKLPINIGNPKEFTILDLAELIRQLIPTKSALKYKDLPKNDPKMRKPNIELAKKILNWSPKIDLIEGQKKPLNIIKSTE